MQGVVVIHRSKRSRPAVHSTFHFEEFCFQLLRMRPLEAGSPADVEGDNPDSMNRVYT